MHYLVGHIDIGALIGVLQFCNAFSVHRLSNILSGLLAPETSSVQAQHVAQYAKRYRLAFTLLNENAASEHLVNTWDIHSAIAGKFFRFI